ncbi:sensor histidine kinase [Prosthecomicrobium pneumaticum]|uniref:histidine kinase n=1 Tax=Prosthecomicrobium pneumaticum TaxID=81895 RepID=A0A7W9FQW2_9HYPH|nr:sensor histidine kinase KdpD [Prosthecomicrobium pneumaticum]MBB5755158.1 two-component system sensor histidine kinase KdpD [Prosthecomicrobium pneumaticum]
MSEERPRPDPEALLAAVGKTGRGRLKVFLGMAPGVGKTFEMLSQARRRRADGTDVAVGVVEAHGRRDTEALCEGLEVLSRRPIAYRGRTLLEFDLDAALARRPELLLVDEFAHSNVPGSRHPKRWQDVEELLDAGIDVWTTLNVQHLESLVDVVWKITGVRQRETVPDSALERADEIEVVDVTPATLRERLAEGKVYVPETARLAAERFFKAETLNALRELALRRTAQAVDDQLVAALRQRGLEGPWAAGERILVLVGGDPMAGALVRAGRRLSDMMMDAPWTVAHVERPNRPPPDSLSTQRLAEALKLAEQLGASTLVLNGDDLVATVLDHARRNNITQIVVGKSARRGLRDRFRRQLAPALLERATGAALHIVTEEPHRSAAPAPASPALRGGWLGHLAAALGIAAATGVAWVADTYADNVNLALIYLLVVLAIGLRFGLWAAVSAAGIAAFSYNFFFLDPRYTVYIGSGSDVFTFTVFFLVALAAGWLTGRVRDQAAATSRRAAAVTALLAASRRLSAAPERDAAAAALAEQLAAATGGRAAVLLPNGAEIAPAVGSPEAAAFTTGDMAAARWAWERGETAGAGTGTLPNAGWTFHPLQGLKTRAGVAAVEPEHRRAGTDPRFVQALLDQGAVALERAELAASAADAEALRRTDRLRSALLNSISHDLRTPLSTVLGSATTLIEYGPSLTEPVRRDLLDSIAEEAERLDRYVGDLLDMTKLEGGALAPRAEPLDARDVLRAAMGRVARRLGARRFERDFPAALSLVRADAALLEQAIVNILENAIAYSPDETPIEVAAYEDAGNVVISIEDEGPGIPTAELERVFEKFRRMEEATDRNKKGAGLGLAIAKGFVEAMGGRIAAASPIHAGRGTRVLISLKKERRLPS